MDTERFDDLAKAVAGGVSRRRLVAGLVGGLAELAWLGRTQADGADIYDPPRPRTTYEACAQAGGEVWSQYGLCNNIEGWRRSYQCGAFQYSWRNYCSVGSQTIDEGCGPCLF